MLALTTVFQNKSPFVEILPKIIVNKYSIKIYRKTMEMENCGVKGGVYMWSRGHQSPGTVQDIEIAVFRQAVHVTTLTGYQ